MPTFVASLLNLLAALLPKILAGGAATTAGEIIAILEEAIPVAIEVEQTLAQPIRNIIAALRGSGVLTPDELDALDKQEAALDAGFDAAADAAAAEDKAAGGTAS